MQPFVSPITGKGREGEGQGEEGVVEGDEMLGDRGNGRRERGPERNAFKYMRKVSGDEVFNPGYFLHTNFTGP